jgi:parvulin-like peptidyl-prolyl isomerase
VKKITGWILLAAVMLAQPLYGEMTDRIVAVVNEEIITLSDLNNAFEPYRKKVETTYREPERVKALAESRAAFLQRLVDASLIEQEAKKSGIVVKDEEVMSFIKDILGRRNISLDEFMNSLASEQLSFASYKKEIKEQMVRTKMIRKEIKSRIIVTEGEIGEYYIKHRSDYEGKEAIRLKQIILTTPRGMSGETEAKLKKTMEDIHKQLQNGESFDVFAANYSQGPAAASGGDLGFIEKGMMLPEVEKAASNLGKDELSGVIRSSIGFHLIKVIDRRGAGLKPLEAVREEIQAKIEEQKLDKKFDEWLDALRKRSHIEVKL